MKADMIRLSNKKAAGEKMSRGLVGCLMGVVVIACSACGGGGGGSTAPAPVVAKAPNSVLIAEYGDSTTAGWQVNNGVGANTSASEPVELQSYLQAQFGTTVTVSNQGVGGTEASQLLNGTDGTHGAWFNEIAASKAQIVTFNFSLNDAFFSVTQRDGTINESVDQYKGYMVALIEGAKSAGKKVVVYTPNPTCEAVRVPILPQYVDALKAVAASENVPIVDNYGIISAMPNWQAMLSDCLHPNDALYAIKAKNEADVLAPIVKSLL